MTSRAPAIAPKERKRLPAFDYTKGALVLLMVLYHWLNYFVSTDGLFYRYLRFLSPSFIFITGFLIAVVYVLQGPEKTRSASKRLFERGLKLFAVFVALNMLRTFVVHDSRGAAMPVDPWSATTLMAIYVSGNVAMDGLGKAAAFNILVPISYLLVVSAALLLICRRFRYTFHVAFTLFALLVAALAGYGIESGNLENLTLGLMGVVFGFIPLPKIDTFVSHRGALLILYAGYTALITAYPVRFSLQLFGVCVNLAVIYYLGKNSRGAIAEKVCLLGKYSLFGYISQIAILQVLLRGLRGVSSDVGVLAISFIAAFALTILSVELLDRARRRSVAVDRVYKLVFA